MDVKVTKFTGGLAKLPVFQFLMAFLANTLERTTVDYDHHNCVNFKNVVV